MKKAIAEETKAAPKAMFDCVLLRVEKREYGI